MAREEYREQIERCLEDFIRDFENLDLERLRTHFDDDATVFPRSIMSRSGSKDIELGSYFREDGPGPDSSMREYARELEGRADGPPYMLLQPRDVKIQVFRDSAVVTFHLLEDGRLGRRTFVFARRDDAWKIVHLHASNVQLD